jgi:hypothetical protein
MKPKPDRQTRANLAALRKSGGGCWTLLKKVKPAKRQRRARKAAKREA